MGAKFRHLAINADDVQRAKAFYESGALQERRELKPGAKMLGFEATMDVEDIQATIATIEAAGGRILMRPTYIEDVGKLVYFEDTEGNLVGAMQYDKGVFD
jgi:predicted enzyme related to lactoylglutathione lyase